MKTPLNPLLRKLEGYLQEQANVQREAALRRGGPVYDFGIGDPREPTPPFIREAFKAAVPEVSQYPSVSGIPALRKAIAGYLRRRFGLSIDPDREILPCQGAKEALFHLPLAALDPARPLCFYPDPAYPVYERAILFARGTPRTLPLRAERGFLPDLDAVPAADWRRTSIVYDNYPHNPTGAAATRAHHQKLASLAKEHGFLLVCDEPYVDLYVRDPPHTALQVARENVLVVHSLSKRSGMTGYRSGFIAGEPDLIASLREARANFGVAPQTMVQQAATVAWSDDGHVEERRRVFADKRALILAHLGKLGLQVGGEGAFYLWVHVPPGETSESYAARLAARGILVVPGPNFGPSGAGFIRLAMVPTLEDCKKAAAAWPT
jgi:acetylornithine/N-succinyldiaminopimelate aminotransferase